MRNFHGVILEGIGGVIGSIAAEAIEVARTLNTPVQFEFNKVKVHVTKNSHVTVVAQHALEAVQSGTKKVYV